MLKSLTTSTRTDSPCDVYPLLSSLLVEAFSVALRDFYGVSFALIAGDPIGNEDQRRLVRLANYDEDVNAFVASTIPVLSWCRAPIPSPALNVMADVPSAIAISFDLDGPRRDKRYMTGSVQYVHASGRIHLSINCANRRPFTSTVPNLTIVFIYDVALLQECMPPPPPPSSFLYISSHTLVSVQVQRSRHRHRPFHGQWCKCDAPH